MRVVLIAVFVYTGLLLVFLGLRQPYVAAAINEQIADATAKLIDDLPVDHRHTLFSEVLAGHIRKNSPYYVQNSPGKVATYELVTMSPCNPRIRSCG